MRIYINTSGNGRCQENRERFTPDDGSLIRVVKTVTKVTLDGKGCAGIDGLRQIETPAKKRRCGAIAKDERGAS